MGQYYIAIILAEKGTTKNEYIRVYLDTSSGCKLMEHSYLDNPLMKTMEILIGPEGPFYKSRVVWAGDYADPEPDSDQNLFSMVSYDYNKTKECTNYTVKGSTYSYIVNHTKKQYVEKPNRYGLHYVIHLKEMVEVAVIIEVIMRTCVEVGLVMLFQWKISFQTIIAN